jgi:hypothetical protein
MVKYITGMKFSTLCLLACGAVVREKEALTGLEAVVERYGFSGRIFTMLNDFIAYNLPMPLPLEPST